MERLRLLPIIPMRLACAMEPQLAGSPGETLSLRDYLRTCPIRCSRQTARSQSGAGDRQSWGGNGIRNSGMAQRHKPLEESRRANHRTGLRPSKRIPSMLARRLIRFTFAFLGLDYDTLHPCKLRYESTESTRRCRIYRTATSISRTRSGEHASPQTARQLGTGRNRPLRRGYAANTVYAFFSRSGEGQFVEHRPVSL